MKINKNLLANLISFRQNLHSSPELSGKEENTSKKIIEFISQTNPDALVSNIGGYGIAVVFDSQQPGYTTLIRADIDALPIQETNSFKYKSSNNGIAHLCGHDGHSAILAGMSFLLQQKKPKKGKVVLLFQPSEETGEGAALVIKDNKFKKIKPDYAFAFHNLPGYERGVVCIKDGSFASSSTGIIIKLKGLSSHAAHPEDGNNPDKAVAKLILGINEIASQKDKFQDFALATIIHVKLGEQAFGTTPGTAVVMATLRTYLNDDMDLLKHYTQNIVKKICNEHNIKFEITYTEHFPATVNNSECVEIIKHSAIKHNITVNELKSPFRWSEDFGHFTENFKGGLFGIGSGKNHPQLHNEDYDFPDDIIEPALLVFDGIIRKLN
jgi:amidohydrolase